MLCSSSLALAAGSAPSCLSYWVGNKVLHLYIHIHAYIYRERERIQDLGFGGECKNRVYRYHMGITLPYSLPNTSRLKFRLSLVLAV